MHPTHAHNLDDATIGGLTRKLALAHGLLQEVSDAASQAYTRPKRGEAPEQAWQLLDDLNSAQITCMDAPFVLAQLQAQKDIRRQASSSKRRRRRVA